MEIAKVIRENRRKKGYTQEQLAGLVGVSAPAVSKWESGASLPDLPLLPPIARALGVTPDVLLGFQETLGEEEVNRLVEECAAVFARDGYSAGREACEALLLEYPNDAYLRFRTAGLYQRFLVSLPERSEARLREEMDRIYALMQQVYDSGDSRLHLAAAQSLASYALMNGELDRAEALLAELPRAETDPGELYPLLYLKKGEPERAACLLEQRVYHSGMCAIRALSQLSAIAAQGGDRERALACSEASGALAEALGLQEITGAMQQLSLLNRYTEKAVPAAEAYLNRLASLDYDYRTHPFLSHLGVQPKPEPLNAVKRTLLEGFENDGEYAALREEPRIRKALERLRKAVR